MMTTINSSVSHYAPVPKTGGTAQANQSTSAGQENGDTNANVDVVTISARGRQMSDMRTSVQRLTQALASDVGVDTNAGPSFSLGLYSQDQINAASGHTSPIAWALGLNVVDSPLTFGVDKAQLTDKIKVTSQNLDDKIADALKAGNITLGKNETLKLSVNNHGEVKVADGVIGRARADEIQKVLNQDSSIGKDMLLSHAQRDIMNVGVKQSSSFTNTLAILTNEILEREMGVPLSDFSLNTAHSDEVGAKNYTISCEGKGDEFIENLFENERALYHKIEAYVSQVESDPESANFEYGFSYSNGILVENGATDERGMQQQAKAITAKLLVAQNNSADYFVELDSEGNYVRSDVSRIKGGDPTITSQFGMQLMNFFTRPQWLNGLTTGEGGVTKLFSFDSMRLLQYQLGPEAEGLKDFKTIIAGSIK